MKKIFICILFFSLFSCSKDDDNSENQLDLNYQNMVGNWEFNTIVRSNGSEEIYPHRCSTNKDYVNIVLNTTITSYYYYPNCIAAQFDCDNYYFQGNQIKNCFEEFNNAHVTSLTASTMKIEYDTEVSFGAITGNIKSVILKKR